MLDYSSEGSLLSKPKNNLAIQKSALEVSTSFTQFSLLVNWGIHTAFVHLAHDMPVAPSSTQSCRNWQHRAGNLYCLDTLRGDALTLLKTLLKVPWRGWHSWRVERCQETVTTTWTRQTAKPGNEVSFLNIIKKREMKAAEETTGGPHFPHYSCNALLLSDHPPLYFKKYFGVLHAETRISLWGTPQ